MNRIAKVSVGLLAALLPLGGGQAVAQGGHWQNGQSCVEVRGGASAIYWRLGDCDSLFATNATGGSGFTRDDRTQIIASYLPADWNWGFRVFGGLTWCGFDADADYLWYETGGSASVLSTGIIFTGVGEQGLEIPGVEGLWERIDARGHTRYQHVNVAIGAPIYRGCGGGFGAQLVLRYVDLHRRVAIDGLNPTYIPVDPGPLVPAPEGTVGRARSTTGYRAGGVGAGFKGDFDLYCGLRLAAHINLIGTFGSNQRPTSSYERTPPVYPLFPPVPPDPPPVPLFTAVSAFRHDEHTTCWVPGFDGKVGLQYGRECSCFNIQAEIAWETFYYFYALHEVEFEVSTLRGGIIATNTGDTVSSTDRRSTAFGGPTFSLMVNY